MGSPGEPRRSGWRVARVVAAAVPLAMFMSCGLFEGERPELVPSTTTVLPTEPSVLDLGAEPRQALRYALTPGHELTTMISTQVTVDQTAGTSNELVSSPAINQTVLFRVVASDASGSDLSFEITDATVDRSGTPLSDDEWADLTSAARQLVGLTGTTRMSDRGKIESFEYDHPADLDLELAHSLEAATNRPGGLALPLPVEAVGVGARWETITSFDMGSVVNVQTTTYTITAIEGSRISYTGTLTHRTTRGPLSTDLEGTVDGRIDLNTYSPNSDTSTTGTSTEKTTGEDGATTAVTQVRETEVTILTIE